MSKTLIKLENVSKYYKTKTGVSEGMRKINLDFNLNEFVAITGESGSGKTTLLNVISGLDSYEDGELYVNGLETSHYTVKEWEEFRAKNIGFVFQNYNVIDSYTVYQNVIIALEAQGYDSKTKKQRALELIDRVGLTSHKNQKTAKLSGGQKQRVVIARALAKNAPIILADEPTGNLDEQSGKEIMKLLKEISKDKLIILVTHNFNEAKDYVTRNVVMQDGAVKNDFVFEKTEKRDLNDIANNTNESNNIFKKSFLIAGRNILSTPKRSIFSLLLSMLVIGVFVFFYSTLIKNAVEDALGSNYSRQTVNVLRRDNEEFTKTDIDYLKGKMTKNSVLYPTDIDSYSVIDENSNLYVALDYNMLFKSEYNAVLPSNGNEVLIYEMPMYNEEPVYKVGSTFKTLDKTFTVVGIVDNYFSYQSAVFFHRDFIYDDYDTLILNKLIAPESSSGEITVRGVDRQEVKLFKDKIDNDTYRVIDENLIFEKESEFIIGTIYLMMWLVLIAILSIVFLVIFHVQKNVMESRKKDFAVYRSIGISEKEVGAVVLFEQLIVALAATILAFIALTGLSPFVSDIQEVTRNITLFDYIAISIVFAAFSLMLGLKYNKRIFNVTVIESLKEDF
ncbi:MAG: ABC transporter ATP-binding protein/permease [Acholeplasma sp.]|nr:ABC transporter ATP-binding protein/permease [Acholeplasma sp.]